MATFLIIRLNRQRITVSDCCKGLYTLTAIFLLISWQVDTSSQTNCPTEHTLNSTESESPQQATLCSWCLHSQVFARDECEKERISAWKPLINYKVPHKGKSVVMAIGVKSNICGRQVQTMYNKSVGFRLCCLWCILWIVSVNQMFPNVLQSRKWRTSWAGCGSQGGNRCHPQVAKPTLAGQGTQTHTPSTGLLFASCPNDISEADTWVMHRCLEAPSPQLANLDTDSTSNMATTPSGSKGPTLASPLLLSPSRQATKQLGILQKSANGYFHWE